MPEGHETCEKPRLEALDSSRRGRDGGDATVERRVRELERENERLSELLDVLGHDLRNHLAVAKGRLELARADSDDENLESAARSHDRMEELLDDLLAAKNEGFAAVDTEPVSLTACARRSWGAVDSGDAEAVVGSDLEFVADRARLSQLLENLFRNAVEHGSADPDSSVSVRVGALADGTGFFVADDGCGLPTDERLFEEGYSTATRGTGLGLSIVQEVAAGHGWTVDAMESETEGARFEISGIERPTPVADPP